MEEPTTKGRFHAISSFAIKSRGEFYIIGRLIEGEVQAHWFANIQLNLPLSFALKIKQVEAIEMAGDTTEYLLLTIDEKGDNFFSPLLGQDIGSESIEITAEGEEWTNEKYR
ncbi:MAG: hypothetical protein ACRYFZ_24045 [Janthinobacterium lividum]